MSRKKTTTTKRNTRPAAKPAASAKAARSPKSKPAETKPATAPKAEAAKPAEPKEAKVRKLSLLSAAAAVLAESDEPLNCRRMIDLAKERGLWTPGAGKTIMREIRDKGDAARFRKSPLRGHYLAPASAS